MTDGENSFLSEVTHLPTMRQKQLQKACCNICFKKCWACQVASLSSKQHMRHQSSENRVELDEYMARSLFNTPKIAAFLLFKWVLRNEKFYNLNKFMSNYTGLPNHVDCFSHFWSDSEISIWFLMSTLQYDCNLTHFFLFSFFLGYWFGHMAYLFSHVNK